MATSDESEEPRARSAPQQRRRSAGDRAREQILDAALGVLKRDGYHALSMRRVAQECEISVGNLTYHYPAKSDLVDAMVDRLLEGYELRFEGSVLESSDPEARVRELVAWLLRDAVSPETSALFRELWVLARHEPHAAGALADFYDAAVRSFVKTLEIDFPEVDRRRLEHAAWILAMLTEGTNVLFAEPRPRSVELEHLLPLVQRTILGLLEPDTES